MPARLRKESRAEGWIVVNEGGDVARAILYNGLEGVEEEGEEEKCGEIGGERGRCLVEELGRTAQVLQPGVISHGGVIID